MSKTNSDFIRDDIRKIVKAAYPNMIRQKDLIAELKALSNQYTTGAIRGVLNKIDGIGGIFIPISNVISVKRDNKAFYEYSEGGLKGLKMKLEKFDEELQEKGYLNLNIAELTPEELQKYLVFINVINQLKRTL